MNELRNWPISADLQDVLSRLDLHVVAGESEEKLWQEIERVIAKQPPRENWTTIGMTYHWIGACWFQHLVRLRDDGPPLGPQEFITHDCNCGAASDPGSCGHHLSCPMKPIEG